MLRCEARALVNKVWTISLKGGREFGERAGTRTLDLLIKSQLLYRLSYALAFRQLGAV